MKKYILLLLISAITFAQNPTKNAAGFYAGSGTMQSTAIGQFDSTSKGFLFPRMTTTQRNAIASPATSLVIFNTTTGAYNYYTGSAWTELGLTPDLSPYQLVSNLQNSLASSTTKYPTVSAVRIGLDGKEDTLPDQVGNAGKFLTTNGTVKSWATVGGSTPTLQEVTDVGYTTTNDIISYQTITAQMTEGVPENGIASLGYGQLFLKGAFILGGIGRIHAELIDSGNECILQIPNKNTSLDFPDGYTIATTDDIPTTATDIDALKRDGGNANTDIDIGANDFSAKRGTFTGALATSGNLVVDGNISTTGNIYSNGTDLVLTVASTTADLPDSTDKRYQTDAQRTNNDATSPIQSQIDSKQASLGFTPENVTNKITGTLTTSTTSYPASSLVKSVTDANAADIATNTSNIATNTSNIALKADKVSITGATNTKITYNAQGIVTAGTTLTASDIPNITESQVTNLVSDLAGKQASLGFTPENVTNKITGTLTTSTTSYPASSLVKSVTDANAADIATNTSNIALKSNIASPTFTGTVTIPSGSVLGTPTSINLANATFPTLNQNTTGSAAIVTTTINSGVVATTQTANDNSTKVATTAYADAKVQNSLTSSTAIAPSATAVNTALDTKATKPLKQGYTTLTGVTGVQVLASLLIPADWIASGDGFEIIATPFKSTTASAITFAIYHDTTVNGTTNAIATGISLATTNRSNYVQRILFLDSTTLRNQLPVNSGNTVAASSTTVGATTTFTPSVNNYITITVNPTVGTESVGFNQFYIRKI